MWIRALTHRAIPRPLVALGSVGLPEKRLKILKRIWAILCRRLDVVNLPPKFGFGVTVLGILHRMSASISPPNRGIILVDGSAFLPDSQLGLLVGAFKRVLVCHGICSGKVFPPNVQAMATPLAGASVDRGVDVELR